MVKAGSEKVPIGKPPGINALVKRGSSKDARDVANLPDNMVVKKESKLPDVNDLIS